MCRDNRKVVSAHFVYKNRDINTKTCSKAYYLNLLHTNQNFQRLDKATLYFCCIKISNQFK